MEIKINPSLLDGLIHPTYHDNGTLKECMFHAPNSINTPFGPLVPKYQVNEVRDKFIPSLNLYPTGVLKSIYLNEHTFITTSYGLVKAELLTFYPDGSLQRLFPTNGKMTGYWSAEDEGSFLEPLSFSFPFTSFSCKISSLQFYPSGKLKSLTLWEKQYVGIQTEDDIITGRIGFSLYEKGSLKSLEPAFPTPIKTPIGTISSYDIDAIGIHAESNSLVYDECGKVLSLITSTDQIKVNALGETFVFEPLSVPSLLDLTKTTIAPIKLSFKENKVEITDSYGKKHTFSLKDATFEIHQVKSVGGCGDGSDCSSCDLCG
jgi:hypothetical protein